AAEFAGPAMRLPRCPSGGRYGGPAPARCRGQPASLVSAASDGGRLVAPDFLAPLDRPSLAVITWTAGGMLGGLAAVLAAPLTGLSAITFTVVVTVAGLGAALLGGFESFPLTLLGGLIIGVGEAMATLYGGDIQDFLHQDHIAGLNRMPAFLVIFLVVVVRGRGLPLRSHV